MSREVPALVISPGAGRKHPPYLLSDLPHHRGHSNGALRPEAKTGNHG